MDKKFIIFTTIQAPTKAIAKFSRMRDWHVVVVGDRKTPHNWYLPGATYLGPERQIDLFGTFATLIPWNHYARKCLGYLFAIRKGATIIAESDDDNSPLSMWDREILPEWGNYKLVSGPSVVNIYKLFSKDNIWPRGLPLDCITDTTPPLVTSARKLRIPIVQYLVNGDTDVDAIYRLTRNQTVMFRRENPVVLDKFVFAPFNSQNTVWRSSAFPFLYLPAYVSFRFTDILRGWVAQRCLWSQNGRLAFGPATVRQDRNKHDLMKDFESEIPCYLHTREIINVLKTASITENSSQALVECYKILKKIGVVSDAEIKLAQHWVKALQDECNSKDSDP